MTPEQRRLKIIQVLTEVIEDGLDQDIFHMSCKNHNLTYDDFNSITRTDIILMQRTEQLKDVLERFCEYIKEEMKEEKGK